MVKNIAVFGMRPKRCTISSVVSALIALLFVFFAASLFSPQALARQYAAIVLETDTGKVLFSRYADQERYPASLTKMMTLYMVFTAVDDDRLSWSQKLPVSSRAVGQPPSRLGLKRGQTISTKDAVLALITKSANDAATVLGESLGKTEWQFANLMTEQARRLGMAQTTFRNASGLPDRRQVSTARDMAKLGVALQRDFPHYFEMFNTTSFKYRGTTYRNHNTLLKTLQGTNGIKTGYIRASGFNLVSSVEREGKTLIGVVFGGKTSRSRDAHMINIINQAFRRAGPVVRTARLVPTPRPQAKVTQLAHESMLPTPRPRSKQTNLQTTIATATKTLPTIKIGNSSGIWGIQVGAFQSRNVASNQVHIAMGQLPAAMHTSTQKILETFELDGKQLFRARVAGFDRKDAIKACSLLMSRQVSCVAIPPERLNLSQANDRS